MKKLYAALVAATILASCQPSTPAGWQEFKNEKYGISFSYPPDWYVKLGTEQSLPDYTGFTLAEFQSPSVKKQREYDDAHPAGSEGHIDHGSSPSDLTVSIHYDYMRTDALAGIFMDFDEKKTDIDDFFTRPHTWMQGVKKRAVSGVTGYEVNFSDQLVFVVVHRGNLFEFQMPYIGEMTGTALSGTTEEKVLQSIKLY